MYTSKKCENGMKYIIHGPFNDMELIKLKDFDGVKISRNLNTKKNLNSNSLI